jgi:hypothetical protein
METNTTEVFKFVVFENGSKIYERDIESLELAILDADTAEMAYPKDDCKVIDQNGKIVYVATIKPTKKY